MSGAMTVSELVEEFVSLKLACGFKYEKQQRALRQFVSHCAARGTESAKGAITEQSVGEFLYTKGHRATTVHMRERVMRDLAEYAESLGMQVYACPVGVLPRTTGMPPYIFTDDEIRRLFAAIDSRPMDTRTIRSLVDPALFRTLYGTGMRVSEALGLTLADFDDEAGTLMVRGAKNGKDRVIPVSARLSATLAEYISIAHPCPSPGHRIFYAQSPALGLSANAVYDRFVWYLAAAGIPRFHGGPRVHSFRHGFAVGCLRKWALQGDDLTVRLPYLRAYMGHSSPEAAQYYLRLTADAFPELVEKVQLRFGYVIPVEVAS